MATRGLDSQIVGVRLTVHIFQLLLCLNITLITCIVKGGTPLSCRGDLRVYIGWPGLVNGAIFVKTIYLS